MSVNQTLERLYAMRLRGLAEALKEQMSDPEMVNLRFEERLAWLVDRHWMWRENRSFERRLKNARLKERLACLEDINYRHRKGLDRSLVRSLAGGDWVTQHHNLILTGPCGVGKTFVACAFAQQAIREGYTALYWRLVISLT